ncbi:Uncharacterized protein APZ42_008285 [Daphnia magna]|uniref:Uncharacterized protein n=1 Tax=Daphnia magna TaxID=35525 RepID=A0A164ERL4_9CRUS|nr:Uncharacterized protein APZ42_008285 [Daphnia magna]
MMILCQNRPTSPQKGKLLIFSTHRWLFQNKSVFTFLCRILYVASKGAVFYPEGTLALGDSKWVVIYDVPTKRAEQVIKLVTAWVDNMARTFDKAITAGPSL